jgi:hypothetical protein
MWATLTINEANYDVAPAGAPPPQAYTAKSRQEALDAFYKNVASARAAIEGASNERLI